MSSECPTPPPLEKLDTAEVPRDAAAPYFLAWQTWNNLRILCHGSVDVVRHFLTIFNGEYYFLCARITQSCLESLFSHVRQLAGGNNNPIESAYSGAIASIRIMNEEFIGGAVVTVARRNRLKTSIITSNN